MTNAGESGCGANDRPASNPWVEVLHEDDDLLVVNKPAGLVCHPTKGDAFSSLISRLRGYRAGEPVFLVNRLDRETSGVTVAVKSAEAARMAGALFESRQVRKEYLAVVHGHPVLDEGSLDAPLGKAEGSPVAIQDAVRADGAPAVTRWRVVRRWIAAGEPFALLSVEPETGRKHQIRIHLAHAGHPIVGDKIYGGDPTRYLRFVQGQLSPEDRRVLRVRCQALHASWLEFEWRGGSRRFEAEPEGWFRALAEGESVAWDHPLFGADPLLEHGSGRA